MKGIIFNIQRYSLNDGPGIRTTVFLKGCPLKCKWCHNPESISLEKELILHENRCIRCGACFITCNYFAIKNINGDYITDRELCAKCFRCVDYCFSNAREIAGKEVTIEEVIREIGKDKIFYEQSGGGVTFSGGEPFLQFDFLTELLKASKQLDLHTAVDTSGYTSPEILNQTHQFVDLFLFDIKTLDDENHRSFTGVSNKLIISNLKFLVNIGKKIIIRIPIIPSINNDFDTIQDIGSFIKNLNSINEIHLLPYHKTGIEKYHKLGLKYDMEQAVSPSNDELISLSNILKKYVPNVIISG